MNTLTALRQPLSMTSVSPGRLQSPLMQMLMPGPTISPYRNSLVVALYTAISLRAPPVRRLRMKGGSTQESLVKEVIVGKLTLLRKRLANFSFVVRSPHFIHIEGFKATYLMPYPTGRILSPFGVALISCWTNFTVNSALIVAGSGYPLAVVSLIHS